MPRFDASQVLQPLREESPCGDNPEYGEAYQQLERTAEGREESQFAAAEEPDWGAVENAALAVLDEARELRTLGYLGQAYLSRGDWLSFTEVTRAIAGLLQDFWDSVHPQIDPADGDATARINAVEGLAHPHMLLGTLRRATLIDATGLGRFTMRDVAVALGKMEAHEGEPKPEMSLIDAAAKSLEAETVTSTHASLLAARSALHASSRAFAERLGASEAPDLDPLLHLLDIGSGFLEAYLPREVTAELAGEGGEAGGATVQAPAATGEVNSRDDVVRQIDRICDYYARSEPSSPVPILLKRARHLVHKSFPEILTDLIPDAAGQFRVFEGNDSGDGG